MEARVVGEHYLLPDGNPGQLRAVLPEVHQGTVKGQFFCAVPVSLDACRILNNLGYRAPSPIRTDYDWPGRYTPRWYQIETAEHFTLYLRAHCHNAQRTGKTLATLWAADYLRRVGKIRRTLILAPLSTLWDVWEQNIFESFPLRTYTVLHGDRRRRQERLKEDHHFYIVNHHGGAIIEEALRQRPDIDLVVVDEIATFRNSRGKSLFGPLNKILNLHGHPRAAWGLTGTPTPNEPTDAYAQAKLITPEKGPKYFKAFRYETMLQVNAWKWVPRRDAAETVAKLLSPTIRFERSVCTDLEPVHITRRAELSAEQQKAHRELISLAKAEVQEKTITAVNAAALLSKIVQAACGVVYGVNGEIIRLDFGPRLKVLEELIEENNEKVLVFVPFTGALDAIAGELRKRWSVAVVDGGVSAPKRNEIFRNFRNLPDPHILVCHPGTMAHGLDLTAASLTIWYAPFTRAEIYQQANARTDGSRQTVKIDIAHIYATPEEKQIYTALNNKGSMQDIVLNLVVKNGKQTY